jgi:exopolyphosphatase / guanosine-5'-triphosphate,3'-diphosphate pyrophosphatase
MRIATVDVGTNTILLLVADVEAGGHLRPVYEEERFVRLGEAVDAERRLRPAAMDRVLAALYAYRATAAEYGAEIVAVVATSASRDAANRRQLVERVKRETGLRYEVISGEEEARWAFRGACSAFPDLEAACVIDVGGGSTELVAGQAAGEPERRVSLDVGAVRLTEQHFATLPPRDQDVMHARQAVASALDGVDVDRELPLVGAAGTVTALARVASPGDPERPLSASEVRQWRDRLLAMGAEEVRALDPAILTGRADVFAAGVLIIDAVMQHGGWDELLPSPRGLRHGVALRWLEENRQS